MKKFLLIIFLLVALIYVTNITTIPNNIILFKGEELNIDTVLGIYINENTKDDTMQASKIIQTANKVETKTVTVSLLNILDIKDIEVNTIPKTKVIPLGNSMGLKLYTTGVLVVGMTELQGQKPYQDTGIEEGDIIVEINEEKIADTEELIKSVNSYKGNILDIKYIRDGIEYVSNIKPIEIDGEYKLGLWVRDGAAGIGTMTYYEPSTKKFAALGHGIIDVDTDKLINISSGELITSKVISIVKGEKGSPGEIKGSIIDSKKVGDVFINSNFGIYGDINNISQINANNNELEVANRNEIKEGEAKILLDIEDGIRKEYSIEIDKIYKNNNTNNKSMLIKVTDEKLLELTGGIIQRNEWSSYYSKQ